MTNIKVYVGPYLKVYNAGPDLVQVLKNDVLWDCWEDGKPLTLVLPLHAPDLFGRFLDKKDLMDRLNEVVDWDKEVEAILKKYPEAVILMSTGVVCPGRG